MNKIVQLTKRWLNILSGKSTVAVKQGAGKCYTKGSIQGYYNDLTGKVSPSTLLDENGIPINIVSSGEKVCSLVTIMQYALGCYDLYLLENNEGCLEQFLKLADYVLEHQEESGKWDARASIGSSKGNSSCMAQGQGCSILLRAYQETNDARYFQAARKAVSFMLLPSDKGGTAVYQGDDLSFEKYPPQDGAVSSVLNGWIFALFGLYDYALCTDSSEYRDILERSCRTLEEELPLYDRKFWSNYDLIGTIASPAYHSVHISLLSVLAELTGSQTMQAYAERFENYEKSPLNYMRAVAVKIVQKLTRPADAFLVQ
jgi:heparosan-N-sulfate-glucuronate 5-epimerase